MRTLLFCLTLAIRLSGAEKTMPEEEKKWRGSYDKAIDMLEAKYPDVLDDNSIFTRELDRRLEEARKNNDAIIQNPECVFLLAEKLAVDLRKASIPFTEKTQRMATSELPLPSTAKPSAATPKAIPNHKAVNDAELKQWKQKYPVGFDGLAAAYPEIEDKCSPFRIQFAVKLKIAEEKNDPRLNDIDFIRQMAKSIPHVPVKVNKNKPDLEDMSDDRLAKCPDTSKLLHEMVKAPPFDTAGRGRLVVSNGVQSHAIVKLITADKKAYSFYIKPGDSFTVENIPDNDYRVIFAFSEDGKILGLDNFAKKSGVSEFQEGLSFSTHVTTEGSKIIHKYPSWSLTLYAVNNGNAKTKQVDDSEFEKY